ncbi:hypothetical protein ES708_24187 [subsurface metagenome]
MPGGNVFVPGFFFFFFMKAFAFLIVIFRYDGVIFFSVPVLELLIIAAISESVNLF